MANLSTSTVKFLCKRSTIDYKNAKEIPNKTLKYFHSKY